MIWRSIWLIIIFFFFNAINAQTYSLSSHLKEISGLEFINDSILVAHNDSGNSPHLFLISHEGKVIKKVLVSNATNIDWEDIASDDEFLYIGDIGNNLNKRKDLKIYRIKITDLFIADSVIASPMHIAYADQKSYPPNKNERNFDSECLISAYGDLWIFTKNHSEPFDGYSKVYRFKFQSESYLEIPVFTYINMGKDGYYFDTPTAGDFQNDKFYLNTYNRYLIFELKGNEFKLVKKKNFNDYNQKEALTIHNSSIWVANEFNKVFGKQKLKRINLK